MTSLPVCLWMRYQISHPNGVDETRRKFFGTLYNTYSFFALYANVDGFFMWLPRRV